PGDLLGQAIAVVGVAIGAAGAGAGGARLAHPRRLLEGAGARVAEVRILAGGALASGVSAGLSQPGGVGAAPGDRRQGDLAVAPAAAQAKVEAIAAGFAEIGPGGAGAARSPGAGELAVVVSPEAVARIAVGGTRLHLAGRASARAE